MSRALVRPADSQTLLDELRIVFRICLIVPSNEMVAARQLAGIALAAEVARTTERAIFMHARALYFARPDGTLDSSDSAMVEFDQRLYEQQEFTGHLRLDRTHMGMLSSYVLQAHRDVVKLPHFRFAKVA